MGIMIERRQLRKNKADHKSEQKAEQKPDSKGQLINIHGLRNDRRKAGAVKPDINIPGQMHFMVSGI